MSDELRRLRRSRLERSPRTAQLWERVVTAATRRSEELGRPLRVLDLGGGTGGFAVPLAACGHDVVVVDPSPDALASLERRLREEGIEEAAGHLSALQGDSGSLVDLGLRDFDLVLCHGVLEVVDDPTRTLADLAAALAPGGVVSLVVASRFAAVLSRALAGRFAQAERALGDPDGRYADTDPMPRRFDADELADLVRAAGLAVDDVRGLRVFTDHVPSSLLDSDADQAALLALERALAAHPDRAVFDRLGSMVHLLAHR